MTGWWRTLQAIATMEHRLTAVADGVSRLDARTLGLTERVVRLETIVAIARPDGSILRVAGGDTNPDG